MIYADLLVLAIVTLAALDAYRNGKKLDVSWRQMRRDYDAAINRLTFRPTPTPIFPLTAMTSCVWPSVITRTWQ